MESIGLPRITWCEPTLSYLPCVVPVHLIDWCQQFIALQIASSLDMLYVFEKTHSNMKSWACLLCLQPPSKNRNNKNPASTSLRFAFMSWTCFFCVQHPSRTVWCFCLDWGCLVEAARWRCHLRETRTKLKENKNSNFNTQKNMTNKNHQQTNIKQNQTHKTKTQNNQDKHP